MSIEKILNSILQCIGDSFSSTENIGYCLTKENEVIGDVKSIYTQLDPNLRTHLLSMGQRALSSKKKCCMVGSGTKSLICIYPIILKGDTVGFIWIFDKFNSTTSEVNSSEESIPNITRKDNYFMSKNTKEFLIDDIYKPVSILLNYQQLLPEKFDDRSFMYSYIRISTEELVKINEKIDTLLSHMILDESFF